MTSPILGNPLRRSLGLGTTVMEKDKIRCSINMQNFLSIKKSFNSNNGLFQYTVWPGGRKGDQRDFWQIDWIDEKC